ncbi:MAG: hypothetical protein K2X99_05065 [Gemmatimonadaceae bacterium]|nr:hypothetical protein [Gemmatimonadaceae bacterium]
MTRRLLVCALIAMRLEAQVGHLPEKSPYVDLEFKHHVTLNVGYMSPSAGPAGVAPKPGPMVEGRYDIAIGGPANVTFRVGALQSTRDVKDPFAAPANRVLGEKSSNLLLADLGITLNLTGRKSFHRLVPTFGAGVGIVSDFVTAPDPGGYNFGTKFAFTFGPSVRWHSGRRLEAGVSLTNRVWQTKYPEFYRANLAGTPLVPQTASLSAFNSNWAFTSGLSWHFYR